MIKQVYHGGAFFSAIGEDFSRFERYKRIVNADVLDAWFDPSPKVLKVIKRNLPYIIKTSPPTHSEGLIEVISKYRKVPKENIVTAGGSSDLIFTFFPRLVASRQKVFILDPMYGEYAHIFEHVIGARLLRFKLHKENSFAVRIGELIVEIKKQKPHVVVLVNPNSPTGQYLPRRSLVKLIRSVPKRTLVVVDETYIEYVNSKLSLEREVRNFKNLVIIKSMSKAYALSGARVGYLVADKRIIDKVGLFVPPWSVSLIGQVAGVEALKDSRYYQKRYKQTFQLRSQLLKSLRKVSGIKVYDSVANYILVELVGSVKAKTLVAKLRRKNIFIRNCDSMSTQFKNNFVRIAVKDSKTNRGIVLALKEVVS